MDKRNRRPLSAAGSVFPIRRKEATRAAQALRQETLGSRPPGGGHQSVAGRQPEAGHDPAGLPRLPQPRDARRERAGGVVVRTEDRLLAVGCPLSVLNRYWRRRGSRASRNPSPSRLYARTVTRMAIPGKTESHQAISMFAFPSVRMLPHVGVGGRTPRPRKERPASVRMAPATPRMAETRTG